MLITLVLLGKMLERRAMDRVRQDMEDILAIQAVKVRVVDPQAPMGRFVAADQISTGDRFKVQATEVIGADGVIIAGQGLLDESALSGEARLLAKSAGDCVRSGTRLAEGDIVIEAAASAAQSTFGQMTALMQATLGQKTRLEGSTDRLLRWFVPVVGLASLCTAAGWSIAGGDLATVLVRAITVLVIACPCALGIAVPLARVAAVAHAGRRGILVRRFAAFEQAPRVSTVVFDKTGTLTEGRWQLRAIRVIEPFTRDDVLSVASGLEKDACHGIGRQILATARQEGIAPAAVGDLERFANGIAGRWQGQAVRIGSRGFGGDWTAAGGDADGMGCSVYLVIGDRPAAVFDFGDRLRPDAIPTVARLQRRGLRVCLISGDSQQAANHVGAAVGVDVARGGLLPAQKADFIRSLQAAGQVVAMVGDGINDGLALAQSDMAVSLYSGAALAKEAADLTLMGANPAQLLVFFDLAGRTLRVVRQNVLGALAYNTVSIPIACAGWLTPVWAVGAMLLSSLTVIGNTLRLVRMGLQAKPLAGDIKAGSNDQDRADAVNCRLPAQPGDAGGFGHDKQGRHRAQAKGGHDRHAAKGSGQGVAGLHAGPGGSQKGRVNRPAGQ
jgi:heavy metal translocating P-type ATPase